MKGKRQMALLLGRTPFSLDRPLKGSGADWLWAGAEGICTLSLMSHEPRTCLLGLADCECGQRRGLSLGQHVECLCLCPPSQPPASPSTQEAIQGMLSMANLQASDSCLQTTWGAGQTKGGSLGAHSNRKNGGGSKSAGKRLLKRTARNSVGLDDYEEEQDHLDACFKDSDYGEAVGALQGGRDLRHD